MNSSLKSATCLAAALAMSQWSFARDASDNTASGSAAAAADQSGNSSAHADAADRGDKNSADMDRHFVRHAIQDNLAEIADGKFAEEHAQSSEVKQFAQHMIMDHTKANQQLQQIAQSKKFDVPTQPDEVHQAKMQEMEKMASRVPAKNLERLCLRSGRGPCEGCTEVSRRDSGTE